VLARRADGELAPAPQRQEKRRGRRQPRKPAESARRLDHVGVDFFVPGDGVRDALAQLLRRRDRINALCHQRRCLRIFVARPAAFVASGKMDAKLRFLFRRRRADGVERRDRFECLVGHH
jgi:hypothetical protein